MKKIFNLILFITIVFSNYKLFSAKNTGIGIILGSPTGFSFKHFYSNVEAIDFALGYNLSSHLHFHSNYLYHISLSRLLKNNDLAGFYLFFPLGGKIYYRDKKGPNNDTDLTLSLRFGTGISYRANRIPVEAFFEIVPAMDIIPKTELSLDLAIGGRYYF